MSAESYDDIPYDSTPFAETHPDHLCVLGRLFGLATPPPESARILELGCASGGNIIPLAFYLPQAQILGIELSAGQVAAAQQLAAANGGRQFVEQIDHLFGELFSLYAHQAIRITPRAQSFDKTLGERPCLHALARAQAESNLGHLATVRHTTVQLDAFATHLARLLDGSRTQEELH